MVARRSTNPPPKPNFGRPAKEYNQGDWSNFTKQLQSAIDDLYFPSMLRGGELFLNNLPGRGAGLPPGSVFEDSGVLKIVRANDVYADSLAVSVSVGTVTVTT